MILVNNPGSWANIYPPLRHAAWHGLTPADLVFPFFLFIVGVAMSLSFARRQQAGATVGGLVRKILFRAVIIFACGLLLNGFPFILPDSLTGLRIPGVLQRIALCYLAAGMTVVLTSRNRDRILAAAGFLVLYELLMRLPLAMGWGAGSFALEDNFVRWADLAVLGEAHLYRVGGLAFDPEGLVSTLPAVVTTLAGFFAGEFIRGPQPLEAKLRTLVRVGAFGTVVGLVVCRLEPVNKQLWTVSYVVVTGGFALLALAVSSWMIDVRGWRRGTLPAVVFGSNPLVAFVGSGLLARILVSVQVAGPADQPVSLKSWVYQGILVPLAGPVNGSVLFALLTVGLWLGILWVLHDRRIFIKI